MLQVVIPRQILTVHQDVLSEILIIVYFNMQLKIKKWYWILTFPFAHNNITTVGDTIYYAKNCVVDKSVIAHETIHSKQQKQIGLFKFLFLYLGCFPLFYNPWRYKWEFEAYIKGSLCTEEQTRKILSSVSYGWLLRSN